MCEQWVLVSVRSDTAGASKSVVVGAPVGKVADASVKLAGSIVDDDRNWNLEEMMTMKEVE